jgi:hypothetical protein
MCRNEFQERRKVRWLLAFELDPVTDLHLRNGLEVSRIDVVRETFADPTCKKKRQ